MVLRPRGLAQQRLGSEMVGGRDAIQMRVPVRLDERLELAPAVPYPRKRLGRDLNRLAVPGDATDGLEINIGGLRDDDGHGLRVAFNRVTPALERDCIFCIITVQRLLATVIWSSWRCMVEPVTVVLPGAGRNQSLGRAFRLLECLAAHPTGTSVAVLTRELGLPRATVTRLLGSLADAGAVARSGQGRNWALGSTILRLSSTITSTVALRDRAQPVLERLTAELEETMMLAVPTSPTSAQVILEIPGPRIISARGWSDQALTSPASGFVRQLLAELPATELPQVVASLEFTARTPHTITTPEELIEAIAQIHRQGHSLTIDQYEEGLAGLGVSVRHGGTLVAMIAVYLPTSRFDDAMYTRALRLLNAGASELEGQEPGAASA
jgi:DNA-binding IclR family transcriptional regulator